MIDPSDPPRTWTVAEADDALDVVRSITARARAAMAAHRHHVREAAVASRTNGHGRAGDDADVVRAAIGELEAMGVLLRDPGRGLVDFPARAPNGRPYWLCWLDGEPSVEWWHWVEDGFAGRTPVDQLPT